MIAKAGLWHRPAQVALRAAGLAPALALALALSLVLALAGCVGLTQPDPGAPAEEVRSRMGSPLSIKPLPEGGERWLYSTLPMGREVYHVDLDRQGTMRSITQVLDFQHLSTTPIGWSRRQVLDFYGPPYEITEVASFQGKVWTYRFMDDMHLRRLAHIHIDQEGRVAKVMFTDEPTAEDNRMS
ncbi:MAG: hypothetical protein LBE61_05495 [Burkholderiaceae bacterium]|jgi:hypothetical protein|nr:hypothetical protein [Burkholderiaceae bacterium]